MTRLHPRPALSRVLATNFHAPEARDAYSARFGRIGIAAVAAACASPVRRPRTETRRVTAEATD